ncbi:hypothetical protein D3C87_2121930 [compost metagenome]
MQICAGDTLLHEFGTDGLFGRRIGNAVYRHLVMTHVVQALLNFAHGLFRGRIEHLASCWSGGQ